MVFPFSSDGRPARGQGLAKSILEPDEVPRRIATTRFFESWDLRRSLSLMGFLDPDEVLEPDEFITNFLAA